MKKRQIIILASAALVLLFFMVLGSFLGQHISPPEQKEVKIVKKYVKTVPVEYSTIQTEITSYGRVITAHSLDMIAEKTGKILRGSVPLKAGQNFNKGQLICKIDDTEARLNLRAQKSNFLRDLAAILPDLKVDFENNYSAWHKYFNVIDINEPLPVFPEHKSDKEKVFLATRNIFSTYYSIKSAESSLQKHAIYAPFNGTIAEVALQEGAFVNPGNRIATIVQTDQLELKVDIETENIEWISTGQRVKVFRDEVGNDWLGSIARIGRVVNENTQSLDVYITLDSDASKNLYDGLFLEASIPGKEIENAMEVPREAVMEGNKVFIVKDSLLQTKYIEVHKVNPRTLVFSGLQEGQDLVVEPLINAYNNMKVYKIEQKEERSEFDQEAKKSPDKVLTAN